MQYNRFENSTIEQIFQEIGKTFKYNSMINISTYATQTGRFRSHPINSDLDTNQVLRYLDDVVAEIVSRSDLKLSNRDAKDLIYSFTIKDGLLATIFYLPGKFGFELFTASRIINRLYHLKVESATPVRDTVNQILKHYENFLREYRL
jgi:hypothetical protein